MAYDADSGDFKAGQQGVKHNAQTGRTTIAERGVSGDVDDGRGSYDHDNRGVTYNRRTGNAVAWKNGDVYAGHDGNVYQHTDNGWQQHTSNGWQPVQPNQADMRGQLEQQYQSRQVGQQRFNQTQRQWGGGGHFGGGHIGGGGFRR